MAHETVLSLPQIEVKVSLQFTVNLESIWNTNKVEFESHNTSLTRNSAAEKKNTQDVKG